MSLSQQTPRSIEIVPLTLHIGAEIRGVDLTKPLPQQQVKEVRDAFLKWKVVFFRNQHLDHAQHVADGPAGKCRRPTHRRSAWPTDRASSSARARRSRPPSAEQ
jgi:alpha-ketoglutarate-dependent taurine dioxygenase